MRRDGMRRALARLTAVARRVLAVAAIAAQSVVVLAPLSEIHVEGPRSAVTADDGGARAGAAETRPHDEALCPACIVHSIYARHMALTSLPSIGVTVHTALPASAAPRPRAADRAIFRTRAPPFAG